MPALFIEFLIRKKRRKEEKKKGKEKGNGKFIWRARLQLAVSEPVMCICTLVYSMNLRGEAATSACNRTNIFNCVMQLDIVSSVGFLCTFLNIYYCKTTCSLWIPRFKDKEFRVQFKIGETKISIYEPYEVINHLYVWKYYWYICHSDSRMDSKNLCTRAEDICARIHRVTEAESIGTYNYYVRTYFLSRYSGTVGFVRRTGSIGC